jgi:hypothetical protein
MPNRVLSLGAGVQSSTLLLMAIEHEIEVDMAIFSDTGWEPKAVYDWLGHLGALASRAGIPVRHVQAGNLRADALGGRSSAWMPLYIRNDDGSPGMLKRQCTSNYKIAPLRRELRALGFGPKNPVSQLIGISLDEAHRMRDSDVKYIRNVYPLVERGMKRSDCIHWLNVHGYEEPPKSACIGCPYHDDGYWRKLRDGSPEEWADAVDFDHRMRRESVAYGDAFLHADRVPLDEVDLRTAQDRSRQLDLFGNDCSGTCGV